MSDQPLIPPPETPPEEAWEKTLRETAQYFAYPPTPDIAGAVRSRLRPATRRPVRAWRLAAAVLVALLVFSMAVPGVRAFVLEALRIGAVRIFFIEVTATPTATFTSTAPTPTGRPFPTLIPTEPLNPTPFASALDLPGETTLTAAEVEFGARILLPTYPSDLGAPDRVFMGNPGGDMVTLVWTQPDNPTQVRLVLQVFGRNSVGVKYYPWENDNQRSTTVNGNPALWLTEVHEIFYYGDQGEGSRIIDTNVLLWEQDRVTYRLETDLPMEEAVRIAESLE